MINSSSNSGVDLPFKSFANCTNSTITLAPKVPLVVLKANPERLYAAFINSLPFEVWLSLATPGKTKLGQGIPLSPLGGSFEITQINLYRGVVSVISASACTLSFVECVE